MGSESTAGVGVSSNADGARGRGASGLRGTRCAALALAALLVPGLLTGGPPLSAALVFSFLLLWVWLPGCAFARWLEPEEDELTAAAMGLVSGLVLLALAVFVARATGLFALLYPWPAVGLLLLFARSARPEGELGAVRASGGAWLFSAALLVVLLRMHTGEAGPDLMFHGGNAAELTRPGPLLDPRIANRPLNYHLLAHTLPAAAHVVTKLSIAELFERWLLGFHPLVLALLVFVLARELACSAWAGLVAALVVLLHHDLIHGLAGGERDAGFLSHLNRGLFLSPPTCAGLGLLAAQGLVLLRWLDPARRIGAKRVFQLALLAAAASLAKGSVMPVAIAGAGFAFAASSLAERRWDARWLGAFFVMLVAALPATLWLSVGPGSYAGAMFRAVPFASATTSGVGAWIFERLPASLPSDLRGLLVALVWLPGFLGLSGIGALAWLVAGRPNLRRLGPWILGVNAAGLGAALFLLAPGNSQLFFAYDAQVLLALVAGVGAVALRLRRRAAQLALGLLALPFAAAGCAGSIRMLAQRIERARPGQPYEARLHELWFEGAAWLRDESEPGSLLVALDKGLMLTFFAERRIALADDRYAPEGHASRWIQVDGRWQLGEPTEDPFSPLEEACRDARDRADAAALLRLRELTGHAGEIYLVHDDVRIARKPSGTTIGRRTATPALDASAAFERCFENDAVAIYRARE